MSGQGSPAACAGGMAAPHGGQVLCNSFRCRPIQLRLPERLWSQRRTSAGPCEPEMDLVTAPRQTPRVHDLAAIASQVGGTCAHRPRTVACRVCVGETTLVVILIGCLYIVSICSLLSTRVTLDTLTGVLALAALFRLRSKGGAFYARSLPAMELTVGFLSTGMWGFFGGGDVGEAGCSARSGVVLFVGESRRGRLF